MANVEATDQEVTTALGRLLAWPEISRSTQLAGFLEYIVTRTLRGDAASIKAYSIAVDVLGRSPDFDPQTDPIVRVQARRLRSLLTQYYGTIGATDAVRIELPTGRYVPEFVRVAIPQTPLLPAQKLPTPARNRLRRLPWSWTALAVATGLASLVALGVSIWGQYSGTVPAVPGPIQVPVLAVSELQGLVGAGEGIGTVGGLAVELVTDLRQFENLEVRYGGALAQEQIEADYVLSGIVRREDGRLQYSAILTDVASDAVIWNKAVVVDAAQVRDPGLLNDVSGQLSSILGSPRGPLHQRAREWLAESTIPAGAQNLYICRVLFDLYRERETQASGERAQNCLAGLADEERGAGQALAARASLVVDGFGYPAMQGPVKSQRLAEAGDLLRRAIEVAPVSSFVWEQQARRLEQLGETAPALAAYSSALQLNPASTDTQAAMARHLALTGNLDSAAPLSELATSGGIDPPRWYLGVPALLAYRDGNFRLAASQARGYAEADRELGSVLVIMAAQAAGDENLLASYLPRVLETGSFRSVGILTRLRQRISDEGLIRDIRQALLSAGVRPDVLNASF